MESRRDLTSVGPVGWDSRDWAIWASMEPLESVKRERKEEAEEGELESESDRRASELSTRVWWRLERRSSIERCFWWRVGSERVWFEVGSECFFFFGFHSL